MQKVAELDLYSRPGLFSWDHADPGSTLLTQHLPAGLRGVGMDLCCGNGLLSKEILRRSTKGSHPHLAHLHLVDHDWLALDCAKENLKETSAPFTLHWLDASSESLPKPVDWIVCNPPFHQQQERKVELGQSILQQACSSLKRGGQIWLVANRKLPYEKILEGRLGKIDILCQEQGYKIIHGVKA